MNVSLTSALEEFVRRKVATGLYNNASEVIREALRSMIERETGGKPQSRSDTEAKDGIACRLIAPVAIDPTRDDVCEARRCRTGRHPRGRDSWVLAPRVPGR